MNNANLTGGSNNNPAVVVTTLREQSTRLLVEPVTTEFLGTPAAAPEVIVKVGGAVSRCLDDCSYTVNPSLTPVLETVTLAENILTLNISNAVATPPYSIIFNKQTCTYTTGTADAYKCALPTNNNNVSSPIIETGNHIPSIYIPGAGYVDTTATQKIFWPLVIDNLTSDVGYTNGGVTYIMYGTGFPIYATDFNFLLCDIQADVIAVNNDQLQFLNPPCDVEGQYTITVQFNQQTATIPFNYIAPPAPPTITSIYPNNYSPVLKGFMNITGTGFGDDISKISVTLDGKDTNYNVYQLNVLEANDTHLYVRIPGGLPGAFYVNVNVQGLGYSEAASEEANTFTYGIFVSSVTPNTGSINGGTILTITGSNFSPILLENQVYIGDAINWNCDVISVTTTTITCRTPPIGVNYTLDQPVIVVGRAMVDSECTGTCTFTYNNDTYPTVSGTIASSYVAGDSITLTGASLVNNDVQPIVYVGTAQATVTASSNTSVTFTYPALANGTYNLNVYVDGIGYA